MAVTVEEKNIEHQKIRSRIEKVLEYKDLPIYKLYEQIIKEQTLKAWELDIMEYINFFETPDEKKREILALYSRVLDYIYDRKKGRYKAYNAQRYFMDHSQLLKSIKELINHRSLKDQDLIRYYKEKFINIDPVEITKRSIPLLKYANFSIEEIIILTDIYNRLKTKNTNNLNPKISPKEIESISIIEEFVESGKNIEEYCSEIYIKPSKLKERSKSLEENDNELYNRYIEYTELQNRYINQSLKRYMYKILNALVNQIPMENGDLREFDAIDYYLMTDIPLDHFYKQLKKIASSNEVKLFGSFYGKYCDNKLNNKSILSFLDGYTELRCKKDEEGKLIQGSGIIITEEMKIKVLNYLVEYHIPITKSILNKAIERYIDNTLIIEKNEALHNEYRGILSYKSF